MRLTIPASKVKMGQRESLTYKEVREEWPDPMGEITEAAIDETNHIIKGVCLFGRRESDNGYTYQDKAITKLVQLAEGSKVFLNHPSKSEHKDRDGVRDIRDWAGVYYNPRRSGDKVYADLHAREAFFPLLKDIALMRPAKVGNSINSRVRVFVDDKGHESVVDMDTLHSVDMVASGATIENIWESTQENVETETTQAKEQALALIEECCPNLFSHINENVLADKIKQNDKRSEQDKSVLGEMDKFFIEALEAAQEQEEETQELEESPLDNITLEKPIPEELMDIELS